MTAYTVILTEDKGQFLQSAIDSSVSQVPVSFGADLGGCGTVTHLAGRYSSTLNSRINCETPQLGLQVSAKGYAVYPANGTTSADSLYIHNASQTDPSDPFTIDYDGLIQYALRVANAPTTWFTDSYIAGLLPSGSASQFTIRNAGNKTEYIYTATNRTVTTVDRPIISSVENNCKTVIGKRVKVGAQVYGYNQTTCQPTLVWSASINVAYNSLQLWTNFTSGDTDAEIAATIVGGSQADPAGLAYQILFGELTPVTNAQGPVLPNQTQLETDWRTNLLNTAGIIIGA